MTTDKNVNNENQSQGSQVRVRRRRTQEASRDNILAAAEEILTARGPLDLKLTEVAAEAGVATATVLHHFVSIDGVQTALMERMVTRLAERVIDIHRTAPPGDAHNLEAARLTFAAFEAPGAARLAAWLVMTDEAKRLSVVRSAVDEVVELSLGRMKNPPPRAELVSFILASITFALGAGLFGPSLSNLLGQPETTVRDVALGILAAQMAASGYG